MDSPLVLVAGLIGVYASLIGIVVFVLRPKKTVSADRRRPGTGQSKPSALSKLTDTAVGAINKGLKGKELRFAPADKFEQAGLKIRSGDFLLMSGAGALLGAIVGFMLGGPGIALLCLLMVPVLMVVWLNVLASRRQGKFAELLPDTLQMLSGSMRAGHSLLRAVDGAAEEAESPMAEELRRVVNETRIGRDLTESLVDCSGRMKSEDFLWVAQAIQTHREVGGNLAELLDNVNGTIRERAQIHRQVRALSAEGRTSAVVLVSLPIVMFFLMMLINPYYSHTFLTTVPGWIMLATVVVMLVVGSFWLNRLIKPKY